MRRNAMIRGMAGATAMLLLLTACGNHEETPPEPTPTPTLCPAYHGRAHAGTHP